VNPEGYEIREGADLPASEVLSLYESAGWWKPGDRVADIPALLAGSFLVASAWRGGVLVGMGRVLSDGVSDGYIQDVVVLPEHRGRGLGAAVVAFLRDRCVARKLAWIGLIGEPGTRAFYERLGFRVMERYVPMLLEREADR